MVNHVEKKLYRICVEFFSLGKNWPNFVWGLTSLVKLGQNGKFLFLLAVIFVAVFIIWLETIVRGQAQFKSADNIKTIISFAETKGVEAEIAIVVSDLNLNDISSTKGVLKT